MAFMDLPLDAPEKPNKGKEGGACNRRSCQAEPALWYNHGSYAWYCEACKHDIGDDHVNRMGWARSFGHLGHPQFETREEMNRRKELAEIERQAKAPPKPLLPKTGFFPTPAPWEMPPGKRKSASLERMLGHRRRRA